MTYTDEYDYFEEAIADGLYNYGIVDDYSVSLDLTSVIYDDMYNGKIRDAADKIIDFNNVHHFGKEEKLDLVMKLSKIAIEANDIVTGNTYESELAN